MQAFKNVGVFTTLSALSLSSAWAAGGFTAEAKLDGFNVVPPVLTSRTDTTLELTFESQPSTTATSLLLNSANAVIRAALAQAAPVLNPWAFRSRKPLQQGIDVQNIRLYFGQHFANGQPILTLCDQAIPNLKCQGTVSDDDNDEIEDTDFKGPRFKLSDILFQGSPVANTGTNQVTVLGVLLGTTDSLDENPVFRVPDDENGLKLLKALIKRGLIYVVVNSPYDAEVGPDPDGDPNTDDMVIVGYKPPTCSFLPLFFCKTPDVTDEEGRIIEGLIKTDGELRGTLRIKRRGS